MDEMTTLEAERESLAARRAGLREQRRALWRLPRALLTPGAQTRADAIKAEDDEIVARLDALNMRIRELYQRPA